jgi:diacylglycerol kinase
VTQPLPRCFLHAFEGLWQALRSQRNLRIHLGFTAAVAAVGWLLALTNVEWAILTLTIGLVWATELFNTAVEHTVDLISPTQHPMAKIAKDVAAAAVLVAAIAAAVVGLIIFVPHLIDQVL